MSRIIVIDGLDGCGKATQAEMLYQRLAELQKSVYLKSFPNYKSSTGELVKSFLAGENLGKRHSESSSDSLERLEGKPKKEINPYIISMLYEVDRGFAVSNWEKQELAEDAIIICDRYIASNAIYQGSKFESPEDKKEYLKWLYETTEKAGLPKEDIVIILDVPVELSQSLMDERYTGTDSSKDINECNIEYLEKCHDNINSITDIMNREHDRNWVTLKCVDAENRLLSKEEIADRIYNILVDNRIV